MSKLNLLLDQSGPLQYGVDRFKPTQLGRVGLPLLLLSAGLYHAIDHLLSRRCNYRANDCGTVIAPRKQNIAQPAPMRHPLDGRTGDLVGCGISAVLVLLSVKSGLCRVLMQEGGAIIPSDRGANDLIGLGLYLGACGLGTQCRQS